MSDQILTAPAADRNKEPILEVLKEVLPAQGTVLEVASGTGQHVVHFASALPGLTWQPSDPDARHRASIRARVAAEGLGNVLAPLDLDVLEPWPEMAVDAVIVANLLHVAPVEAIERLCAGAAGVFRDGGVLAVYGPFNRGGEYTSEGNARFDRVLREQDDGWGIRDLEAVEEISWEAGLSVERVREMPANNFLVIFRKGAVRA